MSMSLRAYRRIGSVTEATGEQLGVFDGVCGQVDLEAGSICVAAVTVVTFEGFVFVVLPAVRLESKRRSVFSPTSVVLQIFRLINQHLTRKN